MLFGFARCFHSFVREGSKQHTIRARRKQRGPRVGDIADCYGDSRQKSMFLLGRWPVTRVQDISIDIHPSHPAKLIVKIDGQRLADDEAEALFYRDGFRFKTGETYQAMAQAREFWKDRLPFTGDLIHWQWRPDPLGVNMPPVKDRRLLGPRMS